MVGGRRIVARFGQSLAFDDVESEWVDLDGVRAHIATPSALYRMKRHTVRAIDRADALLLKQRFGLEED